jgi:hypothetical protein
MVYYQQQNVALLAQISKQVSSIAPQVPIPSSPPPPYPNFTPNPSDVRVNAYWFMSLVFSLSAALLATLVQQWVRDYMQVFQQNGNPLKGTRLRQYLYEGAERWYMLVVAKSVPGLVHVSLFLFFVGIIDSLLSLNTTVSITTIIPITICALFYVLSTFAPIIDPRSPFQTPLSTLIWYLTRKLHPRTLSDRASGGDLNTVSSNMSEGQMQLAMDENEDRKHRDIRAMRWLIDNRTEDDEMESFVVVIPGAFTSEWGVEVWRMVAGASKDEGANSRPNDATVRPQVDVDSQVSVLPRHGSPLPQHTRPPRSLFRFLGQFLRARSVNGAPHDVTVIRSISHARNDPHAARDLLISDLCERTRHLLDTCRNPSLFTSQDLWRKRARGCVETVASLVFCANIKPDEFGDLEWLLLELGKTEKIRELPAAESDGSFVTRWTCLYLVVVTQRSLHHSSLSYRAKYAIKRISEFRLEDKQTNIEDAGADTIETKALGVSQRIDSYFETARQFCVGLQASFRPDHDEPKEAQVKAVLKDNHKDDISKLENANTVSGQTEFIDQSVAAISHKIGYALLPGVSFDELKIELIQPDQFFNISAGKAQVFTPQIIFLVQRLRLLGSYAPKLCAIMNGQPGKGSGVYQETLESLDILWKNENDSPHSVIGRRHLMERQLWRLLDLRDGGGFGFLVELSLLVLAQLLSKASSRGTHTLYSGMFRAITSGWRDHHKRSIGTQRVILNLICDIANPKRGVIFNCTYPEYITEELLVLLRKIVEVPREGQSGSHIDDAEKELDHYCRPGPVFSVFATKAKAVISPSPQAPALS